MSDLFSVYENNLSKLITKLKTTLDNLGNIIDNKEFNKSNDNKLFLECFNLISESEKIIKQMNIENSSIINKTLFDDYQLRITTYSSALNEYKKTLNKLEDRYKEKKNSLLFDGKNDLNGNLIQNEQLAYSGNQKLQEARRVLAGTEDIGTKILSSMEKQTENMKAINVKIGGMNDDLENSNNILNRMKVRYEKNKRSIIIFGGILIIIIICIILYKIIL
jgi:hypothetical protein